MLPLDYKIVTDFSKLTPDPIWSFKNIGRSETSKFTHSYHRYPAKFIPNIVEKLITDFTNEKSVICDPFGGCGTTLVEAKLLHRQSMGFDINPIAKLITETKVTAINPKGLSKAVEAFKIDLDKVQDIVINHDTKTYYWFDEKTICELDKIYYTIKQIKNSKKRRFFLCAFSHVLKNCSRWLMKSIKPTIDKDKNIPSPRDVFFSHLQSMIKKNEQFYNTLKISNGLNIPTKMRLCDSTKKLPVKNESVDLVITSPPYVTSYEYADLHQLSLIWFSDSIHSFKKCNNNYSNLRKKFVGSKYKREKKDNCLSNIADRIIEKLLEKDRGLAVDVSNYFIDMKNSLKEIYRILKKKGKACIVIGDTSLRDINISNAQVAAEQMHNVGFRKVIYIKREVSSKMIVPWRDTNNGRFTSLNNPNKKRAYEFEYIIIMEK